MTQSAISKAKNRRMVLTDTKHTADTEHQATHGSTYRNGATTFPLALSA
ncbi:MULTISPECIES: hypothetical protein [Acetobacter]|nr:MULTISPECIES: hypothetical protein [Acetobacter]